MTTHAQQSKLFLVNGAEGTGSYDGFAETLVTQANPRTSCSTDFAQQHMAFYISSQHATKGEYERLGHSQGESLGSAGQIQGADCSSARLGGQLERSWCKEAQSRRIENGSLQS